jgi:DNA repair exonuclease SbcCD ATPase subunit
MAPALPNANSLDDNHNALSSDTGAGLAEPDTDHDLLEGSADMSDLEQLRSENEELRAKVADCEQLLAETTEKAKLRDLEQKEMESLIEEKSDLIRELHLKLQDTQGRPAAATPREEELLALHEELEQERRQLKEDEESLMQQMRQMEVQMSRERAEMARQRNELQRLHSEIRHELELAGREAELRERLQPLQRKHQELMHRKGGAPVREAAPVPGPQNGAVAEPQQAREGGLLRRLFG